MSEKRAKKLRRAQLDAPKAVKAKSTALFNAAIALVVAAFLAIGGYAVVDQYRKDHPFTPTSVADYAKEQGISTEEFLAKYGLDTNEEIKADTDMNTALGAMTVEKYAEYNNTTVEALKEQYSIDDSMPEGTTFMDAQGYIPMSKIAEQYGVTDYETFLKDYGYGLTSKDIPPEMLYKDADPLLYAAYEKSLEQTPTETESTDEVNNG